MQNGSDNSTENGDEGKLSYKFQRLRERLRDAIRAGELTGKLPGERQLAKKFRVNAKTLSKALTDLAAEGLLDRSIGRGTYVRGVEAPAGSKDGKWLLLADESVERHWLLPGLRKFNPETHGVLSKQMLRPSDLAGVTGVIDVARETPDEQIRDLLVRGISTVMVLRQPTSYATHTVTVDRQLGAANLARELALLGHRRFFVSEAKGIGTSVHDIVRQIATRYDPGAVVDHGYQADAPAAVRQGATAIICACTFDVEELLKLLAAQQIRVPAQVSFGACGAIGGPAPCTGYFVHLDQMAESIAKVIREHSSTRPVNLWLAGTFFEKQTLVVPAIAPVYQSQPGVPLDSRRPA